MKKILVLENDEELNNCLMKELHNSDIIVKFHKNGTLFKVLKNIGKYTDEKWYDISNFSNVCLNKKEKKNGILVSFYGIIDKLKNKN